MRAHNGMRPLDVIVLMKLIAMGDKPWQYRDLSASLSISISEISESIHRSQIAGLIDHAKKVNRRSLMEFIEHGLSYVFPQLPGSLVKGVGTAHSHPFYKKHFTTSQDYVWEDESGTIRGQSIDPLHKRVPEAAKRDEELYKLLAGLDILRVGRVREKKLALAELEKEILNP